MNNKLVYAIYELSDSSFNEIKNLTSELISYVSHKIEDVNSCLFSEKIYDYIETFAVKNNLNINDLADTYTSCLLSELSIKPSKKSREELYLNKLKQLKKEIKQSKDFNFSKLEDFTRVFVALFSLESRDKKLFDFTLSKDYMNNTIEGLKNTKTYKNMFKKDGKLTDKNIKYSKIVFSILILEIVYIHMIDKAEKDEDRDWYG